MKTIKFIYMVLLAAVLVYSCKEDKQLMYEDDARVYFDKAFVDVKDDKTRDSLNFAFTFLDKEIIKDTVYLKFRIIGHAVNRDREIKVTLSELSNAKLGYHLEVKDLFIPANQYEARVPVILYRRAGLKDSLIRADFNIVESKDFKPGYKDNFGNNALDRLTYKLTITDKISKPSIWNSYWQSRFGDYSDRKLVFLVQATQRTNWNVGGLFPQDDSFLQQRARLALYEYEQANGPLYDENNVRVTFPSN